MNPITSLRIDDKPEVLQSFAVPTMSLSSSRGTMVPHTFALSINPALVPAVLEPAYLDWVKDSKADDDMSGGPLDELAEAG